MLEKGLDFISRQWQFITVIFVSLLGLARGVRYIENSAIREQENKRLRESLGRIKQDREFRNAKMQEINSLSRSALLERMRVQGETIAGGQE